jgi:hypothetical protein
VAALSLCAGLGLAGCGGTTHRIPVASSREVAPAPTGPLADSAESLDRSAAVRKSTDRRRRLEQATLPVSPNREPAGPESPTYEKSEPADPKAVMGLDRAEVEQLLGHPGLVRHETPAEVWQYQSRGCVLDVFMYAASAEYQVVYLEARDGLAVDAATAICLGAVMDERRRTPAS